MDYEVPADADSLPSRCESAAAGIRYYTARGDFKSDTTWCGHPWGQFALTAASFELFGTGTWQARLPFVACGLLTVASLFRFVRSRFGPLEAGLAVALLLGNVYWVLHVRQCRYYGASSLLLWLTFVAYWRWQAGQRWGALLFVVGGWTLFQFDFGTFVPVAGVLCCESLLAGQRRRMETFLVALAMAICIGPFVYYYELLSRFKPPLVELTRRSGESLLAVNQYLIPLFVITIAILVPFFRSDAPEPNVAGSSRRRIIWAGCALVIVDVAWMIYVAPQSFYRYFMPLTPLCALLGSYVLTSIAAGLDRLVARYSLRTPVAIFGAMVLIATPWAALPFAAFAPRESDWNLPPHELLGRSEFRRLFDIYLGTAPDPNRQLVEFLRTVVKPGDVIVANGDEIPLMFYLDHPIRGGYPAFRTRDQSEPGPAFLVRRDFSGGPSSNQMCEELLQRLPWRQPSAFIPDWPQAHCPDPRYDYSGGAHATTPIIILQRPD